MKRFKNPYPIEKYKFSIVENKVTATSTYAGKDVTGKATCAEQDTFDEQMGKELAAARCNAKVAKLRRERARNKAVEALETLRIVMNDYRKACAYERDAKDDYNRAMNGLRSIEDKLKRVKN